MGVRRLALWRQYRRGPELCKIHEHRTFGIFQWNCHPIRFHWQPEQNFWWRFLAREHPGNFQHGCLCVRQQWRLVPGRVLGNRAWYLPRGDHAGLHGVQWLPWSSARLVSPRQVSVFIRLTLSLSRVINFNFPCSLTRNITSDSMKNLAFHNLLRWLYYQFSPPHLYPFLFRKVVRMYFLNLKIEGFNAALEGENITKVHPLTPKIKKYILTTFLRKSSRWGSENW